MLKFKVESFFAGVGGICLGFLNAKTKNAQYELTFANEIDPYACETYRTNFSHTLLEGDIISILHPENSNDIQHYQELHDKLFSEPIDVLTGGFPCLTGDTLVLTDKGNIPIVKVRPLDKVLSHDKKWHSVISFMEQGIKDVFEIKVFGTSSVKATGNHRFYVSKQEKTGDKFTDKQIVTLGKPEWKEVNELQEALKQGDSYFICSPRTEKHLKKCVFLWLPIVSIDYYGKEPVYDIEVEESHSFVANGFVSHNCQAFSIAGQQRGFADCRGNLFLSFIDYIQQMDMIFHKKPRILFLENVKNLKAHDNGKTYQVIKSKLEECGYIIKDAILNTMYYSNVPQNRERIYIIGFLNKEDADNFTMFNHLNDFKENFNSIDRKEIIKSIIDENVVDDRYFYTKEKYPDYFEEKGQTTKKSLRVNLSEEITQKYEFYQIRRGLYVRMNKNHVCPTLTANMGTGGHNVPLIYTDHGIRKLTPEEVFKLQGFPINNGYVLPSVYKGKPYAVGHLYKQAGNSVSVPVIKLIAEEILKACSKGEIVMDELKDNVENFENAVPEIKLKYRRKKWVNGKPSHFQTTIDTVLFTELKETLNKQNMTLSDWTEMVIKQFLNNQDLDDNAKNINNNKDVSNNEIAIEKSTEIVPESTNENGLFNNEIETLNKLYLAMKAQIADCTLSDAIAFYNIMILNK